MSPQYQEPNQYQAPPPASSYESSSSGDGFSKEVLWLIIGAAAVVAVIAVLVFFGSRTKSEDEMKAEILRSLSANGPGITVEEKQEILNNLSSVSEESEISAEEKQRILESLSAPPK